MARGKTLAYLLNDLRAEAGLSLNVAHNAQARDKQVQILQRVQENLYDDFAWPHLRVTRDINLQAGQRFYDMPEDMNIDRIEKLEVRYNGRWVKLEPGVEAEHYALFDSDLDVRSEPARRFRIEEDEQLEIWPIPASDADTVALENILRITGIKNLAPLVADDDRCDLDGRLIVLFAAAEMLAAVKAPEAELKLNQANKRLGATRRNLSIRRKVKAFGIGEEPKRILRGPPTIYYRTTS